MAMSRKVPAMGTRKSWGGMKKVVCIFDPEAFDAIRKRALTEKTSFAEQVRILVEWGLEAADA